MFPRYPTIEYPLFQYDFSMYICTLYLTSFDDIPKYTAVQITYTLGYSDITWNVCHVRSLCKLRTYPKLLSTSQMAYYIHRVEPLRKMSDIAISHMRTMAERDPASLLHWLSTCTPGHAARGMSNDNMWIWTYWAWGPVSYFLISLVLRISHKGSFGGRQFCQMFFY